MTAFLRIDSKLTFSMHHFFYTIAALTSLTPLPPYPENRTFLELTSMVSELQDKHGIKGYELTRSWMEYHIEIAQSVYKTFPDVDMEDVARGWQWILHDEKFKDVARAMMTLLEMEIGFPKGQDIGIFWHDIEV